MEKKVRVQLYVTESTLEKLNQLQDRFGTHNRTNTISVAIANCHKREFPDYIAVAKQRTTLSPEEKIKAKEVARLNTLEERERLKAESEHNKMVALCLSFDEGEVTTDPQTGRPACRYPTFTGVQGGYVEKNWVTEPLAMMNEELVSFQYHDILGKTGAEGKANVLKALKEKGLKP